jgi:hypothetical protein
MSYLKLTFDEEQLIKGIKNLQKNEVIKKIENIKTDIDDLKEVKEGLLIKLNKSSQIEIEKLVMSVD